MPKKIFYIFGGILVVFMLGLVLVINLPVTASPANVESSKINAAQKNDHKNPTADIKTIQPKTQRLIQPPQQPVGQNSARCAIVNHLPDPNCTPGAIDPRVTQENIQSTICVSGYSASVRPSTSVTSKIKAERMVAYGDTDSPSNYELDHLISLELGGSPASVLNLFPEPYANPLGAREKDRVENYLHQQVCSGAISLALAQQEIATNWVGVYVAAGFTETTSGNAAQVSTQTITNTTTQQSAATGVVKMSTTGICHAPGTTYYDRTTNYTAYATLDDCLAAGGRLPAK